MSRMSFFNQPEPVSSLAHYRLLSPTAAVRVSPLCLGTMNFGTKWADWMGECSKETSFEILDHYYDQGGNFIDTASPYQGNESEEWIGEWMEKRKNRDQIVLATKYTTLYPALTEPVGHDIKINRAGNSRKSAHVAVRDSLIKLKTDYIDLLYVHWWDYTTSVPELMQTLNHLVMSGKVLYLGASDMPAWVVSKCNQYARDHGMAQFVVYQGKWNLAERDMESEVIPMCKDEGMGVAPWATLGQGKFKTAKQLEEEKNESRRNMDQAKESDHRASQALEKVAKELGEGVSIQQVALAYHLHHTAHVFPIIGGRKVSHLKDNIAALDIHLTDAQFATLQEGGEQKRLFPQTMVGTKTSEVPILKNSGVLEEAGVGGGRGAGGVQEWKAPA
ncbi:hypothetical protein YB2330_003181 [Saitoella coloradoensis]